MLCLKLIQVSLFENKTTLERWNQLSQEQQRKFPPMAPDFVLELLSPTDSLEKIQAKMQEYRSNGMKLGWLIDRDNHYVEMYRINQGLKY